MWNPGFNIYIRIATTVSISSCMAYCKEEEKLRNGYESMVGDCSREVRNLPDGEKGGNEGNKI